MAVTLEKTYERWQHFRNDDTPPTEYELQWRRRGKGARVPAEWAYYLRNNDLRELQEFYRNGHKR